MLYFTSDPHFFHRNILTYEPGRYNWCFDLDDMNRVLASDICSLTEDDTLIILGDLLFDKKNSYDKLSSLLEARKCNLVLVRGNHDDGIDEDWLDQHFDYYSPYIELTWNKHRFCLSHYPMLEWNNNHGKNRSIHLHGHVHSKIVEPYHPRRINVGVDSLDYQGRLISADKLIELVQEREYENNIKTL